MASLPLHPKIVHIPIALSVIIPLVSAGILLAWWRGWFARRTWLVVIALQALLVGSGWVAMETGETSAHEVKAITGKAAIEAHHEAAEPFVYIASGLLALMVVALLVPREGFKQIAAAVAVGGTLVILYLGYQTGEAGGRLVYQYGAARAYTSKAAPAAKPPAKGLAKRHHDDDD